MSPEQTPPAPTCSRRWRTVPLRELGLQARAQAWYRRPLGLERLAETADGSPLWLVLEGASLIWSRTPRRASLRPAQQQRPPSPVAPLVRTATQRSPPIRRYSPSIWGRARMLRLVHPTIPRALLAPHGLRLSWQIVRDRRSVHSMRCRPLMARG